MHASYLYEIIVGILTKRKVDEMSKRKRKSIYFIALLLVIICTFSSTVVASASWLEKNDIPIPTVKNDVYVYDEANIIDDNVEMQINTLLIALEEQTTAEVAVITVESLLGKEIEDYAYNLGNTLGIGKAGEDNGVLLLISKSDVKVRLEIGRGLEGCLNDSKCGRILDDYFVPYRENDQYSEGTYQTIQAVVSVIAKEYGVSSIDSVNHDIAKQIEEKEVQEAKQMFKILIIILVILVILIVTDNIFLGGIITESLFSGGSSGGGFSGGGFGGGSFGGGGATR